MKAIVFDKSGLPTEVLQLREIDKPRPGTGEVLVRMLNASINPGDFLFIQSLYPDPKKPSLPGQVAGNTGAGIIMEKGPGTNLPEGTLVTIYYFNVWAEYAVIPEKWLIPLPAGYPAEKAGQFMNFITAWDLVASSKAASGDWIAVTAANSAVSVMTMQMAARKGVRVIAIVRKERTGVDLRQLGADEVIDLSGLDDDSVSDRIRAITAGKKVAAVLDSIGGPLLSDLVLSLRPGGKVIIYGNMSEHRFQLHNYDVLMNGLTIESYIYRHFFTPPVAEEKEMLREVIRITGEPSFIAPVGGRYRLDEYSTAVHNSFYYSSAGSTSGKGLFVIDQSII